MKRMAGITLLICVCAGLVGCREKYSTLGEAQQAGEVLGECIIIDGVDVSSMTPAEALSAVEAAHTAALKNIYYTVTADEDSLDISASLLPVAFNTKEVILDALSLKRHWPAGNEPRMLYTEMSSSPEELRSSLSRETASLELSPQNASFSYDSARKGRFSYTAHKIGRSLNMDDLCQKVSALISGGKSGTAAALTAPIPPEYTDDMVRSDTAMISEFTTSFKGGSYDGKNRVFNIARAASMIDGTMLKPGEEFDMNSILGDRNGKNGWRTATGIRDGIYVQEYGGGVCQVSTTLYNAVLMADLEVTERYHHSWPLGYIDIGRDATISTGGPNFRFKNSCDSTIVVSAEADKKSKTVSVRIYGRPLADGIKIELDSKKVRTLHSPETKAVTDSSLPPGESKTIRRARRGCVAETYKLYYDKNGQLIKKELVTEDIYRSIGGIVNVSPYA